MGRSPGVAKCGSRDLSAVHCGGLVSGMPINRVAPFLDQSPRIVIGEIEEDRHRPKRIVRGYDTPVCNKHGTGDCRAYLRAARAMPKR